MGFYINPLDGTSKETWLQRNGTQISAAEALNFYKANGRAYTNNELLVVLVLNPGFTAAGVAYDDGERSVFMDERDGRPKWYFAVPREALGADAGLPSFQEFISQYPLPKLRAG